MLTLRSQREDRYGNEKIFFEGRVRQCRYCKLKDDCMSNPAAADHANGHGRQVSFITKKSEPRANFTDWMKERIDTVEGKQIYSHRMSVIEPVFANICSNKKLNRFSLRGKEKVESQWQLYCIVHNIEKLMNYGELAA